MSNIFTREVSHSFSWNQLGDIKAGRGDLGVEVPLSLYRLLEFSINHVLVRKYGPEESNEIFREAGYLVGREFATHMLDLDCEMDTFVARLQQKLREMKIGILRIEQIDEDRDKIILTVAQDLDCSGLPPTDEVVCNYDEGFLAGIFETYTGKRFLVREIDCWASGDRVCRFRCNRLE